MRKWSAIVLFWACFWGLGASLARASEKIDIEFLIDKIDKLYRSKTSMVEMEMTIVTPNWERTLQMDAWSEGMDETFIVIKSPKKDKGIATLRVDQEMWNYFPKIDKVMKVPPSMMMGSWMGSDFTNDDLVKESTFLEDYHHRLIEPENAEPDKYYVELTPKEQTATVWGKIVVVVRQKDYIPLWEDYYDEKGKKMRIMHFREVKELGGRTIPAIIEVVPLTKEGHKTTVRYVSAEFDQELSTGIFTLRNLQKPR